MDHLMEAGWGPFFESAFKNTFEDASRASAAGSSADQFFPGRILRGGQGNYLTITEFGELPAHPTGLLTATGASIAAGDWVVLSRPEGGDFALVHELLPRRTSISRKAPSGPVSRVLAANVDTVLLTQGLDRDWNPRRMERYLALVHGGGAEPCIVLNKSDLCDEQELAAKVGGMREIAGDVPIHVCSAAREIIPPELRALVGPGRTLVLLGSSGAGKSTLVNRLLGFERQETGRVSESHGKGRHTTTARELIVSPGRGVLIDTPGLREVALDSSADLEAVFTDIMELAEQCRFRDCAHESEPGCAVRAAADTGELDPGRLESYFRLSREMDRLVVPLTESEARRQRHESRKGEKKLGKLYKSVQNRKRKERGR